MKQFAYMPVGTGAALPARGRHPAAHIMNVHDRLYLIDCGEGTQLRLRKLRVKMQRINHVFISHLHGDHYLGLVGFISSLHLNGRREPLHVYAPAMLKDIIDIQFKASETYLRFPLHIHAIDPVNGKIIFTDEGVSVSTLQLKHRIPCCGFVFTESARDRPLRKEMVGKIPHYSRQAVKQGEDLILEDGKVILNPELTYPPPAPRRFAYCSDTAPSAELIPYIKNVDLLYHEATFATDLAARAKETFHSTAAQAAEVAQRAQIGQLLIGHFSSRYKTTDILLAEARDIFPRSAVAQEGELYVIEDRIVDKTTVQKPS